MIMVPPTPVCNGAVEDRWRHHVTVVLLCALQLRVSACIISAVGFQQSHDMVSRRRNVCA